MKKLVSLTIIASTLLGISYSLQSCRKTKCSDPSKPECENYDPCYKQTELKADFTFGDQWGTEQTFFGVKNYIHTKDSILSSGNRLLFKPITQNVSYTWQLGAETITDKSFVRIFNNVPEGWYKATLIVKGEPNKKCFPYDDGKDTLTKRWYMMPQNKFPIIGAYKVLFEGATDSSIVQIRPWEISTTTPLRNFKVEDFQSINSVTLLNFINTKDTITHFEFQDEAQIVSGHWIVFNDIINDGTPFKGYVRLDNNKQIVADYSYRPYGTFDKPFSDIKNYKFKGRKIE